MSDAHKALVIGLVVVILALLCVMGATALQHANDQEQNQKELERLTLRLKDARAALSSFQEALAQGEEATFSPHNLSIRIRKDGGSWRWSFTEHDGEVRAFTYAPPL